MAVADSGPAAPDPGVPAGDAAGLDPPGAGGSPPRRPDEIQQHTLWVLAASPITGVTTYLLLVVTARAIGPDQFGTFGVFWAATVISGLGVFLPLEQETTRRGSGRSTAGIRALWRRAIRTATIAAVACACLALAGWPFYSSVVEDSFGLVIAYLAAVGGNLMQFPSRGILASRRRFRDYGLVVVLESVTRAAAAIVLWWIGSTSATPYAAAVALAALASGGVAMVLARRAASHSAGPPGPRPSVERFGRDGTRLVLAASAMQTILNSGTIVAKVLAPASMSALAGQLTAAMTVARLPVLIIQSIQSTYLTRLAARWNSRDLASLRVLLGLLVAGVLVVTTGLAVGAATIGPWVMSFVFGAGYAMDRSTLTLVGLGVGVYLCASVASDAAIALGLHPVIVVAWIAGLGVAAITVVLASSMVAAATLPLIGGALLAALILLPALWRRVARR